MLICSSCGNENPDGFAFCGFCAASLVAQSPAPALEERKVVTVLFCDLVGFTAASEQRDPEDMRFRIRHTHAATLYAEAAARWQAFGNVPERASALLGQGRCLQALGGAGAEVPLADARELFAPMGYKPALAETEALLEHPGRGGETFTGGSPTSGGAGG